MDIARARHQDLATVAVALSRAEAGNTQSLSRLGIVLPKYTAQQDALKAQLGDVKAAEEAQAQARQKNFQGTINLTAAQKRLASETTIQLKQREADLKSQLAGAAASDKSIGATQALAEVQRRYAGQTQSYLETAQGGAARFHVAIQQLQEEIGGAFLPSITHAANVTADWIDGLAKSESVQHGAATAARDIAEAVSTVASGIEALKPAAEVVQAFVSAFGVGPILGFVAALKVVPAVMVRLGVTEAGVSAETEALQATIAGLQGQLAELGVQIAALGPEGAAGAAGLTAVGAGAEVAAAGMAEAEVASVAFGSAIFGPLGLIVGAALLAGGLIYLSQQQSLVSRTTDQATDAFKRQQSAAQAAAQASRDAITARQALPETRAGLTSARADLAAAEAARDTAYGSGTASDADIAQVDSAVASARARVRDANTQLLATERALKGAVDAGTKARKEQKTAVEDIISTQLGLAKVQNRQAENESAASRGLIGLQAQVAKVNPALDKYVAGLEDASAHAKGLSEESRNELAALAGLAKGLGRFPTRKEIQLVLDTKGFQTTLDAAKNVWDTFVDNNFGGAGARGGESATVRVKAAGGTLGKDAGTAFSSAFVTHIDVSGISTAFKDSLQSAQQNIIQQGGSLADSVAGVLDERLRRTTVPLTARIEAIQKSLDAESAARSARDAASAVADAQAKLDQLRRVYGSGPLTAGQSKEIADAGTALADAQQTVSDQAKTAEQKALQDRIDAATKAEDLRKTATTRNLADLSDELSRGKITQEKYVAGVREILAKQGVNFKSAGKLLGTSFADGFQDALISALAQSKILGALGLDTLKGAQRGTKAVNPRQDEAKAIQGVIDQIAGSGGKFTLDGKLPKGVNLNGLISAAQEQRKTDSYREETKKQGDRGLVYAQQTADHLKTAVDLLRAGRDVHVTVDGQPVKKKTRATAKATQS